MDYLHLNLSFVAELKLIFCILRSRFEQIIIVVMSCPELKFYQGSGNHQRKTSCSQGYAIVPSEDTGFWCATTCLLRYFQLSIQLGMKLCSEFDMQFRLSTWRNTCRFMRSQKCQPCASPCPWGGGYLGSLDCLHTKVMGRFLSREEE